MGKQAIDNLSTKIEAIAFDMDGLLLNTEDLYGEVGEILMGRRGRAYREEVRQRMIGLPAPQAFGVLIAAEGLQETWQALQRETDEIFEELLPTRLALMPGLEELLDHVESQSLPRCVATSSTRSFATKALTQVGIFDRFDFVLTAADVPRGKPHPDIYEEAARRMGVDAGSMLVLEDSPTGTRAGVSAGAYVVSVPNAHTQYGPFDGARWVADTLRDERIRKLFVRRILEA
jgi:HAD superfamily hydrolase (TIGR01509 family)